MSVTPRTNRSDDTQTTGLGSQMAANTKQTMRDIAYRYEEMVSHCHPSVVYTEAFWRDLQQTLGRFVRKKAALLKSGGYTDKADELRVIERRHIRTAVELFRHKTQSNPYAIHDSEAWNEFMDNLTQPDE